MRLSSIFPLRSSFVALSSSTHSLLRSRLLSRALHISLSFDSFDELDILDVKVVEHLRDNISPERDIEVFMVELANLTGEGAV